MTSGDRVRHNAWQPPGWPWELEIFALLFVLLSLILPLFPSTPASSQALQSNFIFQESIQQIEEQSAWWGDMQMFIWIVVIIGLYMAHIWIARSTFEWMSTPFTNLTMPPVFAAILYVRLLQMGETSPVSYTLTGSLPEIAALTAIVLFLTAFIGRMRRNRELKKYAHMNWNWQTTADYDKTYIELIPFLHPLVYAPRHFYCCRDGLLVVGWLYVMPLPLRDIASAQLRKSLMAYGNSLCLATKNHNIIQINLRDYKTPVYISPKNSTMFMNQCEISHNHHKANNNEA